MEINNNDPCPCHSKIEYINCCGTYHKSDSIPKTALQLMRSRYSAYSLRLVDYLVDTTHKDKLRPSYRIKLVDTIHDIKWNGLEIAKTSLGEANDKTGKVEFIASYIEADEQGSMREHSRFKKNNGRWYYYDGKG